MALYRGASQQAPISRYDDFLPLVFGEMLAWTVKQLTR